MKFKNYFIYFQLIKYKKYSKQIITKIIIFIKYNMLFSTKKLNIICFIAINLIISITLWIQNSINFVCLCLVRYQVTVLRWKKIKFIHLDPKHTFCFFSMDHRQIHAYKFCNLTFWRVNALSGHMRVHREEKNKAKQFKLNWSNLSYILIFIYDEFD